MNAFLIERLGIELRTQLVGKRLNASFTTSQFDINLVFDSLALKISFFQGQAYFQTPHAEKLQKKNRLPVFRGLAELEVKEVLIYPYDRRFDMVLVNGHILAFYLYGKFSQITHYHNEVWQEAFPVKTSKVENYAQTHYSTDGKEIQDLKFLSAENKEVLENQSFDSKSDEEKRRLLIELKAAEIRRTLYVNKGEKKYTLDYSRGEENIAQFDHILVALDNHSRLYISHQVFTQIKNSHLG
ncbi:MAG: hypothetical protein ABF317_03930, partial [Bacteroidia bacterium]